jgi:hypothetical protein
MFEHIEFQTSDFFCCSPNPRHLFVYTISFPCSCRSSSLLRAVKSSRLMLVTPTFYGHYHLHCSKLELVNRAIFTKELQRFYFRET